MRHSYIPLCLPVVQQLDTMGNCASRPPLFTETTMNVASLLSTLLIMVSLAEARLTHKARSAVSHRGRAVRCRPSLARSRR